MFRSYDWFPLGTHIFYRRIDLFPGAWPEQHIDLTRYDVAAGHFGGYFAFFEKKIQSNRSGDVWLFTASGRLISVLKGVAQTAEFVCFTPEEDILVLDRNGEVSIYDQRSRLKEHFPLDPEFRECDVQDCQQFFNGPKTGLAVLTDTNRFFLLPDVKSPERVERLATIPGLGDPPTCWSVAPGNINKVIVVQDKSVFVLSANECTPTVVEFESNDFNQIHQMAVSMCGQTVAFLNDTGIIWFGYIDNTTLIKGSEANTQTKKRASQLVFAAKSAVVGLWKDQLLAVGDDKNFFHLTVERPVLLVPELDGLRLVTQNSHELLQLIPRVVADVIQVGSLEPAATLVDARKEFEAKSHKSYECLKVLRDTGQLENTVLQCIEAAGHEYAPSDQMDLMQTARLGKTLTPAKNRDEFVSMCRTLRVLNTLRSLPIAMPLTYEQFNSIGISTVIERLIARQAYAVASEISNYLMIPPEKGSLRVARAWASQQVHEADMNEDEIAFKIRSRLTSCPGISFAEIAREAVHRGKRQLAVRLLEFETQTSEQVPLLLMLNQYDAAMHRAIASGDTHLLFTVLHQLKNTFTEKEFLNFVRNYPLPFSLYQKICKEEDVKKLRSIFEEEGDFVSQGASWIEQSLEQEYTDRLVSLKSALSCFREGKSDFAVSVIEEEIKLLELQARLKSKNRIDCLNQSVTDTLRAILLAREYKVADEFKKKYRISDKRFWWLKISVEAGEGNWAELDRFSKQKKSPIGYEPFVDACLSHNNRIEAKKYVNRVEPANRVRYLIKMGLMEEAAQFALENNDIESMNLVISKSGPMQRSWIEPLRQKLLQRK